MAQVTSRGVKINNIDLIYPIGSIYMSVNATNPETLFGGTWEQIKDTFLLACGDTYANGATGGEAKHKLTIDEMPSHNHNLVLNAENTSVGGDRVVMNSWSWSTNSQEIANSIMPKGNGIAHNNMPPYLAVYMWKRIS